MRPATMCKSTPCRALLSGVRYTAGRKGGAVSSQRVEELWQHRAACKGPQAAVFFPPSQVERKDEREARESRAKEICGLCPVRRPCLDYALAIREPHGIWGGLNEMERKQLIAQRAG